MLDLFCLVVLALFRYRYHLFTQNFVIRRAESADGHLSCMHAYLSVTSESRVDIFVNSYLNRAFILDYISVPSPSHPLNRAYTTFNVVRTILC